MSKLLPFLVLSLLICGLSFAFEQGDPVILVAVGRNGDRIVSLNVKKVKYSIYHKSKTVAVDESDTKVVFLDDKNKVVRTAYLSFKAHGIDPAFLGIKKEKMKDLPSEYASLIVGEDDSVRKIVIYMKGKKKKEILAKDIQ